MVQVVSRWFLNAVVPLNPRPVDVRFVADKMAQITCLSPGHFEGKTPREGHQGCLVLARQRPGSPATCNPEETGLPGLPVS